MKICMISSEFPPESAGIGNFAYNLSQGLQKKGNEVVILTRGNLKNQFQGDFHGVDVHRVRFLPLPPFHISIHGYFMKKYLSQIDLDSFDLIHYHTPLVPYLATDLPTVTTVHSSWSTESLRYNQITDLHSFYIKLFSRFLIKNEGDVIRKTDKVTTVGCQVAKDIQASYDVDPSQISVVGNGVDTNFFTPPKTYRDNGKILYSGRLVYGKGLMDLVGAAKTVCGKYPKTSFIIAGEGFLKPKLKSLVQKLHLEKNFEFLGHIDQSKLLKHYQNDSIYVLPSYGEGLPSAVLEAMSCAMPVVATNVSGINEVVEDGRTGLLVPPNAPDLLAKALLNLLENDDLRNSIGENGRNQVKNKFTWNIVTDNILMAYDEVI
ncbi:MAG TPA: glycosyltransferase family 4 protein [Methanobacteriaceae archaeon]|nr:glycosyltransferase family 4 protein [Methanobacteriaceae archaeon]